MEPNRSHDPERYGGSEPMRRDVDDIQGLDEERTRNRSREDDIGWRSDEDLQREGNLGNERNRNEPDSTRGNRP
jgi:hypothetical protein